METYWISQYMLRVVVSQQLESHRLESHVLEELVYIELMNGNILDQSVHAESCSVPTAGELRSRGRRTFSVYRWRHIVTISTETVVSV